MSAIVVQNCKYQENFSKTEKYRKFSNYPRVIHYCISHRGMCRPKGYVFFWLFGLKTGIDFAYFGLESSMVFERTTGAYERSYR